MKAGRSDHQAPNTSAMVLLGHHDRAVVQDVGPDREGADDEQLAQQAAIVGRTQDRHFLAALGDLGQVAEIRPRLAVEQDPPRLAELVEVLAQAGHVDRRPLDVDGVPGDAGAASACRHG